MRDLILKGYRVSEFEFVNKYDGGVRINLEYKYSYNVGYSNSNTCRGDFTVDVTGNNEPDNFHLRLLLSGIFGYAEGDTKESIHVRSFKELYPVARAIIASSTANFGVASIMIPPVDIENQSIYRIDMGKNKQ